MCIGVGSGWKRFKFPNFIGRITSVNRPYSYNGKNIILTPTFANWKIRPQGYKTVFMLNSAEHELFSADKYEVGIFIFISIEMVRFLKLCFFHFGSFNLPEHLVT